MKDLSHMTRQEANDHLLRESAKLANELSYFCPQHQPNTAIAALGCMQWSACLTVIGQTVDREEFVRMAGQFFDFYKREVMRKAH